METRGGSGDGDDIDGEDKEESSLLEAVLKQVLI
jgi:hypothetical protein